MLARATRDGATGGTGVAGRQPVAIGSGAPFCVCVCKGGPAGTPNPFPYMRAAYVGRFGRRDLSSELKSNAGYIVQLFTKLGPNNFCFRGTLLCEQRHELEKNSHVQYNLISCSYRIAIFMNKAVYGAVLPCNELR